MATLRTLLLATMLATVGFAQGRENAIAFEDDQLRVIQVSLSSGESRSIQDHRGELLVYLTANLEGQIPSVEVSWHSAGTTTLQNRAKRRFEGILIGLRAPASGAPAPLPPEVAGQAGWYGRLSIYYPLGTSGNSVRTLVDNDQVLVSRHRLAQSGLQTDPDHFHPREVVLVYLTGGEIRGSNGHLGTRHVRRGDFDVLPAYLSHSFVNLGNDPIEFVMITPK
jgi:hypothetical protein